MHTEPMNTDNQMYVKQLINVSSTVQFSRSILSLCEPWTAAHQASLAFTLSWNLLKLTSIESLIPSNHLILCAPFSSCPQSFSASGSFSMNWLIPSGGQNIEASPSASVLPMNIQDWYPLGLTGLISLLSKGLSRVFSSTRVWKHQFFSAQFFLWSNSHICTCYWKNHIYWIYWAK